MRHSPQPAPATEPGASGVSGSAPRAPPARRRGLLIAIAALLLLGVGAYAGAHLGDWKGGPAPSALPPPPAPPVAAPLAVAPPAPAAPVAAPSVSPAVAKAPGKRHASKPSPRSVAQTEPAPIETAQAAVARPDPVPAPPPPQPPPVPSLRASAHLAGFGLLKGVVVSNESDARWTRCELRLPTNRHFVLEELPAHDSETVNLRRFRQDGEERDVPLDSLAIRCAEGSAHVTMR